MKEFLKKNFAIVLAFTLPLALILTVFLSIYLPSLFLSTNYNFVYAVCMEDSGYNYYRCGDYLKAKYSVVDGKLVENYVDLNQDLDNDNIPDYRDGYDVRLFLHDTQKNESREITLQEAQATSLNGLLTSPDGVSLSDRYSSSASFFYLFDSGSSYGYYLVKGNSRSRVNLINTNNYYYNDRLHFIGWVLPGRGNN